MSGERLGMQSILQSKTLSTAEINNIGELKTANLVPECLPMKHPRGSKSATCARKSMVRNRKYLVNETRRITGDKICKRQSRTQFLLENPNSIISASIIASG